MSERPRFFDDLAGVAGGAMSALAGLRGEAESAMRTALDEAVRKFDLVKREDLEAVQEMAALARSGQEAAEARIAALEARVAALESLLQGHNPVSQGHSPVQGQNPAQPAQGDNPATTDQ